MIIKYLVNLKSIETFIRYLKTIYHTRTNQIKTKLNEIQGKIDKQLNSINNYVN